MRPPRIAAIAALVVVASTGFWTGGSQPAESSSAGSGLAAVTCTSAGQCTAVGSQTNPADLETPLSESWDGRGWTLRRAPNPSQVADSALEALACTSPSPCVAVGRQETPSAFFGSGTPGGIPLAESWDGRAWRIRPIKGPRGATDSDLHGVSCVSTTCQAVGDGETPSGQDLTFAESWDGTTWTLHVTPNPDFADDSFLDAVSCGSTTSCVAVGHYDYEVQQINTRHVTLVESWNGRAWTIVPSPNPSTSQDTELNGVSCSSPARCVAVGFQQLPSGAYAPVAESWDGHAWKLLEAPDVAGSPDAELNAVACPVTDRCVAVGFAQAGSRSVTLAMSFDGAAWVTQRTPDPGGAADSALNGVDCDSVGSCIAVGTYRKQSLLQVAFAVGWDGAAWTSTPMPGVPGSS